MAVRPQAPVPTRIEPTVTEPADVEVRSLRALRLRARLPRALAVGAVSLFALAGAKALLTNPGAASTQVRPTLASDPSVDAFAEAFTRAYLTWAPGRSEQREARLKPFLARDLDPDAGLSPPARTTREVDWAAVADRHRTGSTTAVTVVAELDGKRAYLSVPVHEGRRGFLVVRSYPALVGGPATDTSAGQPTEAEVENAQLRAVAERVVGNFLAGGRENLAADLAPDAVVSVPAERLEVSSIDSVTWAAPGRRVAVQLRAKDGDGAGWTLRYELEVVRRERWYVRAIEDDPNGGADES